MSKLFIKNTKSEINARKSTPYIICKRVKPLKNARFTFCVSEMGRLTKNGCLQYNDDANNFTGYFSVDVDGNEGAAMMMEKKLSAAGKVNIKYSKEMELEEEVEKELRYIIENNSSKWVIAFEVFCFTLLYKNKLK